MNIVMWVFGVVLLVVFGMVLVYVDESWFGKGLSEIFDLELNFMWGCYIVGGNIVVWFGVIMILQWQIVGGQLVQSVLKLGMDFIQGSILCIIFVFSVSVIVVDVLLLVIIGCSIDVSGLQNVVGFSQIIQVVGDGNQVSNVIWLIVCDGVVLFVGSDSVYVVLLQCDGVSVIVQLDGNSVKVQLQIEGVGVVQQWICNGSVGQSIVFSSDGQVVSNCLQIDLVRQFLVNNVLLSQNVVQVMMLVWGVGMGLGQ